MNRKKKQHPRKDPDQMEQFKCRLVRWAELMALTKRLLKHAQEDGALDECDADNALAV